MRNVVWLVAILMLASDASAQTWHESGVPVEDTAWMKSKGDFGVQQLLTVEPDTFLENWDKPTEGVAIETADRAERGQPIVSIILFVGCKADLDNLCDVIGDITILDPSGAEYGKYEAVEVWINKPPAEGRNLVLAVAIVGVIIEPDDPLGEYQIISDVTDRNAGITLSTVQKFVAVEKN